MKVLTAHAAPRTTKIATIKIAIMVPRPMPPELASAGAAAPPPASPPAAAASPPAAAASPAGAAPAAPAAAGVVTAAAAAVVAATTAPVVLGPCFNSISPAPGKPAGIGVFANIALIPELSTMNEPLALPLLPSAGGRGKLSNIRCMLGTGRLDTTSGVLGTGVVIRSSSALNNAALSKRSSLSALAEAPWPRWLAFCISTFSGLPGPCASNGCEVGLATCTLCVPVRLVCRSTLLIIGRLSTAITLRTMRQTTEHAAVLQIDCHMHSDTFAQ
mmetsp:Transcript_138865/g.241599  ORF Transcript_138865/g.241599 Transcript_138865/m.241599 type:complete len:273 (+) Transcript_138865:419-1237(+)